MSRRRSLAFLAGVVALAGAAVPAHAQMPIGYGPPVTLAQALPIAAAAIAEAAKNNWTVVVAIVDTGGHLVLLERMERTQVGSVEVAIGKARTANGFKRPTKAFEDAVTGGRSVILALPGAVPIEGGLPLVLDDKIVGAIGISGATSQQDGVVAKAAADALK